MANCAEKVTLVIFHGERERVVRGNHEVISGMPIAVDLTPEASSILCLFRPAPSKKRVLQTCSKVLPLDTPRREKIQHNFVAVNNEYVRLQQRTLSCGYSQGLSYEGVGHVRKTK